MGQGGKGGDEGGGLRPSSILNFVSFRPILGLSITALLTANGQLSIGEGSYRFFMQYFASDSWRSIFNPLG